MDLIASPLASPTRSVVRFAPIAVGGALISAGAYVAVADPSATGSRYPVCAFHQLTGLWCPGCGLTRGMHELFAGNVAPALGHNLFVPVVLIAIVGAWWLWLRRSWGHPTPRYLDAIPGWLTPVGLAFVVAYGALRNLPLEPFTALAP